MAHLLSRRPRLARPGGRSRRGQAALGGLPAAAAHPGQPRSGQYGAARPPGSRPGAPGSVLLLHDAAGLGQVGDDAEGAAFAYVQAGRDVAQAVQLACTRRCLPQGQHDIGRPRAVDAGPAGRRLASARPPHFPSQRPGGPLASGRRGRGDGPLNARGRRHDRTSRTLSVSRPCHYRAALIP